VWSEVRQVLAHPEVVLQELNVGAERQADGQEIARFEAEIAVLNERERRLVRLYSCGEVQEESIREEATRISRERVVLQEQVASLQALPLCVSKQVDSKQLKKACAAVAAWLDRAGESERTMALEALQVEVKATKGAATVTGVLPREQPVLSSQQNLSGENNHAHVRVAVICRTLSCSITVA
jgi:predicted transcriptional regulator